MSRRIAALLGRRAIVARRLFTESEAAAATAPPGSHSGELASAGGPSGLLACTAVGGLGSASGASPAGSSSGNGSLAARYAALVAAGTLRPDLEQAACIQRLDRLSKELAEYKEAVEDYRQRHSEYEERRAALRRQLLPAAEAQLLSEEEAEAAAASSRLAGLQSWLGAALGTPPAGPQRRSAAQRRAVARARVERQLNEQLGPAPAPPPSPKGVYLHGSVGSGKSLLMDLLFADVAQQGAVPHRRRLHFNAAMLELHSRMHAIERHREAHEQAQMDAYAAAVEERRRRNTPGLAATQQRGSEQEEGGDGSSGWQQVLRLDPIAQKLQRSKLAKLAFRRIVRDKLSRSADEQSASLAAANAPILRHAARALIRNCDTLQLVGVLPGGAEPSSSKRASMAGANSAAPAQAAAAAGRVGAEPVQHAQAGGQQRATEGEVMEAAAAAAHGPHAAVVSSGSGAAGSSARIAALLCFDEMQISDTFTAAALKGLLEALVAEGCVVVATSNRAPHELDSHGLNELMFSHFQETLLSACDVVPLNAGADYRRLMAATAPPLQPLDAHPAHTTASPSGATPASLQPPHPQASYFYPLVPAAKAALEAQWQRVAHGSGYGGTDAPAASMANLPVLFGRTLRVRRAAGGAAWFHFEELCARPLGSADYLALAVAFHTVFLEGVPALSLQVRDQARRFITLIDELYNHRARLVCSAAAAPDQLFAGTEGEEPIIDLEALQFETAVEGSRLRRNLMADGGVAPVAATAAEAAAAAQRLGGVEERFAFARAVSRLYEMQSPLYLESRPRA